MSKLQKLKKWVTLADAAKRLTASLQEPVTESDVLKLVLDGQLLISVYFTTEAAAQHCVVRPFQTAAKCLADGDGQAGCHVEESEIPLSTVQLPATSLRIWYPIDKKHIVLSTRNVNNQVTISGVWDLAMVGGDIDYVYNHLMELLGKQSVEPSLDDFVITNQGKNEHLSLLRCEVKDGKIIYVPSFRIPEDAFLVIRTEELLNFEQRLLADEKQSQPDTHKPKNSHLLLIAALLELQAEAVPHKRQRRNQAAIKTTILEKYNFPGLSKRTLDDVFAHANKALTEAKKSR